MVNISNFIKVKTTENKSSTIKNAKKVEDLFRVSSSGQSKNSDISSSDLHIWNYSSINDENKVMVLNFYIMWYYINVF